MQPAVRFVSFFNAWALARRALFVVLAALGPAALLPAWAVPVTSLYVVIVPAADPAQAAQQAMRVELVKLTGRRSAASDPTLAALIDNARQYVQLERATTTGQLQVLFDEPALAAAIAMTGVTLWNPDRPLLWISLPPLDAPSEQTMRARLSEAAQERGLPITIAMAAPAPNEAPAATAPSRAAPSVGTTPAPAATAPPVPVSALDAARAAGASAALVAALMPSQPGSLQWTLSSSEGGGQWVGSPELAIDQAADTLAAAALAIDRSPVNEFACHISGVTDLASFVGVLDAMRAAPGVTQVDISDVSGDQLTLQLAARGSGPQLERALASARLQPTGTGTEGLLEYRYVAAR
ncbi:MAG TPA: DUF2066 domain-containing protein [Steroidobacteraceae bacterium]|jgi:hypothetical protein|nr:DUF2066 domain-containing protein [Steroidobacteraceae bacterium]